MHPSHQASDPDFDIEDALARITMLTSRERAVLSQLAGGLGNRTIARRLGITEDTVKGHVGQILTKLGVIGRAQAAVVAYAAVTQRGACAGACGATATRPPPFGGWRPMGFHVTFFQRARFRHDGNQGGGTSMEIQPEIDEVIADLQSLDATEDGREALAAVQMGETYN